MKLLSILFLLFIAFSFINAQTKQNINDSSATAAVENWLKVIDKGDYAKSWEKGAELFKKAVAKEQWEKAVEVARKPFGELVKREVKNKKYNTQLPGVPDGEYYSFEFTTSFEKKKESIESVTAVLENGKWKVIGYFVR